jgi:outer membrane autotransporter protein
VTNSGTISLQNSAAADRPTIAGNFVGLPGSTIALDFNSRTGAADQVVIGGSATGLTTLAVAGLTPGSPFTIGPRLVSVQGATSPNAFTFGNTKNFGTLSVVLVQQANGTGLSFTPATIASTAGLSGSISPPPRRRATSQTDWRSIE